MGTKKGFWGNLQNPFRGFRFLKGAPRPMEKWIDDPPIPSRSGALGDWVRGDFFKKTLSVNEGGSLPNVFLKIACMGCLLLGVGLLGGISYLKAIESSEVRSVEDLKEKVSQQEEMLFFWKKNHVAVQEILERLASPPNLSLKQWYAELKRMGESCGLLTLDITRFPVRANAPEFVKKRGEKAHRFKISWTAEDEKSCVDFLQGMARRQADWIALDEIMLKTVSEKDRQECYQGSCTVFSANTREHRPDGFYSRIGKTSGLQTQMG